MRVLVGVLMIGTATMHMQQVRRRHDCQLHDDTKDNESCVPLLLLQ